MIIVSLFGLMLYFDLTSYLNFANIKEQQAVIDGVYQQYPLLFPLVFFLLYVLMTAVSFPGAAVMTLLAGAIFGLLIGTVIVSFASTMGASLAFLTARYLFRDTLQERYENKLTAINRGIEQDGAYYLLTLRLVPLFPFFIINLLMGLTKIRLAVYYWISQLGMLPATIIYVNAGTQLAGIESVKGILSPELLFAFALLGLFPLVVKKWFAVKTKTADSL